MKDFYFITLEYSRTAATIIDPKSKSRFICYKDNRTAKSYAKYIAKHKAEYGEWPHVDLSTQTMRLTYFDTKKIEDVQKYEDLLNISYKTHEDLDEMTIRTGIQYFYCHEFACENDASFQMSGQEIDGEVDEVIYREKLDYNIKNI